MRRNDELLFAEETLDIDQEYKPSWKIIIADDDDEVHLVTRMVLDGFTFGGQGLKLLGAYSGQETKKLMREHPDVAILLLDVVMEQENSGLEVVRYVREDLQNSFVRIILRTGQPGQAPEKRVTIEYDINDYKEKTELTAQKLFTAIMASLRAYRELRTLERHRKGFEQLVTTSGKLFQLSSSQDLLREALPQYLSLLDEQGTSGASQASGFVFRRNAANYTLLAGQGQYAGLHEQTEHVHLPSSDLDTLFEQAALYKQSLFTDNAYVGYFLTKNNKEYLLYIQGRGALSDVEQSLIKMFSTNIAVALDNISLRQEMEETQREVVFTLGESIETRSEETGYHVKRVGDYCYLLALRCGLGHAQAELIRLASPMHDVGKIGIPDAILNKPGKLTNSEFEVIKTHTSLGYNILKGSSQKILTTAARIALEHHERWDGLGYPQGLQGKQIDLFARITKVADVFDALSCRRSYKAPWTLDQILRYFQQERGGHFDPRLVDLLMDNLDEFLEIKMSYPDEPV